MTMKIRFRPAANQSRSRSGWSQPRTRLATTSGLLLASKFKCVGGPHCGPRAWDWTALLYIQGESY